MDYKITTLPPESVEISNLSAALHQDLELKYGKGSIEDFVEENKSMLVFYVVMADDKTAAACGALKHFDDKTAEVKRIYVKKDFRGKGLSKLILKELEKTATKLNYKRIILETGLKQPEAVKLYESSGYTRIRPYGRHQEDPDSVCYEKIIA